MLRLLHFWLFIAAAVSSLGLLVMALPLAALLLDGTALPVGHAGRSLRWLLVTATLWLLWLGARQWQAARNDALRQALARGEGLQATARPGLFVLLAGLLALITAGSVHALSRGDLGFGLGGLGLALLLALPLWSLVWQVAQPGPILHMDHQSINHALFGPIPWASVIGIQLESIRHRYGQSHHLCLGVRQAEIFQRRAHAPTRWWLRLTAGNQPAAATGTLRLPLNPVDADPELILQAARHCHAHSGATVLPAWHPGQGDGEIAMLGELQRREQAAEELMQLVQGLPDEPSPEQLATLDQAMDTHQQRLQAGLPVLDAGIEQMHQRLRKRQRQHRLLGWIGAGLLLVYLLLRLA